MLAHYLVDNAGAMAKRKLRHKSIPSVIAYSFASVAPKLLRFAQGDRRLSRANAMSVYRCTRAEPPPARSRTCRSVAIVVSPGNVVSSAPCAQPRLTASCGSSPVRRP